jgi:hypothetical protein
VKRIRGRLTYANVMSSIAVFLVLGGAGAYAARKIGSNELKANSVGTTKIKANAVTTRKIKKGAVTTIKLRDGAVKGEKLADGAVKGEKLGDGSVTTPKIANGAVTGAKIESASTPFSRIVHEARGSSTQTLSNGALTVYPLASNSYTQEAGRDDAYVGTLQVTIPETCTGTRRVTAAILVDPPNPSSATASEFVASREFEDAGTGALSARIEIGPGLRFQPTVATLHTLFLVAEASCGGGGGITASFGGIDVIGTK